MMATTLSCSIILFCHVYSLYRIKLRVVSNNLDSSSILPSAFSQPMFLGPCSRLAPDGSVLVRATAWLILITSSLGLFLLAASGNRESRNDNDQHQRQNTSHLNPSCLIGYELDSYNSKVTLALYRANCPWSCPPIFPYALRLSVITRCHPVQQTLFGHYPKVTGS